MSAFDHADDLIDPFGPAPDPDGLLEPDWAKMEPATADVLEAATVTEAPKHKKHGGGHHKHKSKTTLEAAKADVLEPADVMEAAAVADVLPAPKKKHHKKHHKHHKKQDTSLDGMIAASTAKLGDTRADYDAFAAANPVANYAD